MLLKMIEYICDRTFDDFVKEIETGKRGAKNATFDDFVKKIIADAGPEYINEEDDENYITTEDALEAWSQKRVDKALEENK